MKKALVVIDVQQGYMRPGTDHLPALIRAHIEATPYDAVLFSVFVNDPSTPTFLRGVSDRCMGPPETDIAPELAGIAARGTVFRKRTYSLLQSDAFRAHLEREGIGSLSLCGVSLDACVAATAFDAFDRGYDFEVLFDLTASDDGDPKVRAAVVKALRRNIGAAAPLRKRP